MDKKKIALIEMFRQALLGKNVYIVQGGGESFSMQYKNRRLIVKKENKNKDENYDFLWIDKEVQ